MKGRRDFPYGILGMILCSLCLGALQGVPAAAQESKYPEKPVTVYIPYGPGAGVDIALRMVANVIPQYLGQPLVVINKAGAGGATTFVHMVKEAKPDGYSLMGAVLGSNAGLPARNGNLPFKWDDLTFISRFQLTPALLAVRPDLPVKTFDELLDYIRNNPKKVRAAGAGPVDTTSLGPRLILSLAKIPIDTINIINTDGSGQAALITLKGDADFCYTLLPAIMPLVKAGKLRPLLATLPLKELPDVPSSKQLGYPGLDLMSWQGICGPPKLPKYVVNKWVEAVQKMINDASWIKMVESGGDVPAYLGPDDFKAFVGTEVIKIRGMLKEMGLVKN